MSAGARLVLVAALGAGLPAAPAPALAAASKHAKAATKPAGKAAPKGKANPSGKSKPWGKAKDPVTVKETEKDETPVPVPGAKLAVFPFAGDDGDAVHRQVLHVLRGKGLKPNTTLRPMFDSPEQFRETAGALGLVGYVDGEVAVDGGEASATIFLRSGSSGLRIWSATFSGDRRQLPSDVGKALWDQWSAALGRACADAAKPRKPEREPMRINAGTPIADSPAGGD